MTTSGKGFRSGTRSKLKAAKRGKFKVEPFLREFPDGQRVAVKQDPSSHGGMPHTRYKGRIGVIRGKRGSAYIIDMKVGKKVKEIIAKPEHLKAIRQ
jgi:large subunit ribosomal protein L21e